MAHCASPGANRRQSLGAGERSGKRRLGAPAARLMLALGDSSGLRLVGALTAFLEASSTTEKIMIGAIIGDIAGSTYEFIGNKNVQAPLFPPGPRSRLRLVMLVPRRRVVARARNLPRLRYLAMSRRPCSSSRKAATSAFPRLAARPGSPPYGVGETARRCGWPPQVGSAFATW
jgi:hypothetical protein